MKTRIIALILTVVMVLLALTSCSNSYDIARDNLDAYGEFKLDDFLKALQNIEIEDESFTTDETTRTKLVAAKVYNAIVDKIVGASTKDDQNKSGELTKGDVLYFVYKAIYTDENKVEHEFYGAQMSPSTITDKNAAANHVVRLEDNLDAEGKEFFKLIADNLKEGDLENYVLSALSAAELKERAKEELLKKNPDATKEEITKAQTDAVKAQSGDKFFITYTRTYNKVLEGQTEASVITEKATYVVIDSTDPLYEHLFTEGTTANFGSKVTFKENKSEVKFKIDDVEYTYKDITIKEKIESEGAPIAIFDYKPYTDDKDHKEAPSSLYTTAEGAKIDLKDKTLTYHVYPVYAIDAPAYEEIGAADIIFHINSSKLTKDSYKVFKTEGYKNGNETLEDLIKDVALVFDSKAENNKFYAAGTDLKKALDEYDAAVKAGGAKPTDAQNATIKEKSTALTNAKNAAFKDVIAKIVACKTSDNKVLGDELLKEYVDGVYHTEKTTYDTAIQKKIDKKVLDLIYESVTINKYPTDLLEEFKKHIREEREYEFYTELTDDKKTSKFEKYETLENYLNEIYKNDVEGGIDKEAKENLDPILKIFIVSQKLEAQAEKDMPGYVEADIKAGLYRVDGENDQESNDRVLDEAGKFLVDNEYMKEFKSELSSSAYNQYIKQYGELNIRTTFQFQKLLAYLTSVEYIENKEMETTDVNYNNGILAYRVLSYKIVVETEEDAKEENTDK